MVRIGQTKNNVSHLLQLYAFTQKIKKEASETVKIEHTKTIVMKLL